MIAKQQTLKKVRNKQLSNRMAAAKALVKCLELEHISTVFGYPGAAICPFYDALSHSSVEHILVRHEANAGHAASGMARMTGRPAVCCATSGPGAVNLITAIATAYMDSIPIVVITGQVCTDQIGKDVFQEADITGAAEPFVKHSYLIKEAETLPETVRKAFYIASTGRPGPVLIDVPFDVQSEEIEFDPLKYADSVDIRGYKPGAAGNKLQIKRVVEAISGSKKPLICAGGGLFSENSFMLMREIAERADIPVVNTMMGISTFPNQHPLYYGMIGMHGKQNANRAMNECDLLILLGARVNDRAVLALKERALNVIHVDIDPAEIGKNLPATIPVVGDIHKVLKQILEQLPHQKHTEWNEYLKNNAGSDGDEIPSAPATVNPKRFLRILNRLIPGDAVIVADVGQNQIWTANTISLGEGGRFLTSGGMGTMGYSVPAAIGAKKAEPAREVIAVCGDGSFQMQMMELATAVQHNINIKIIIMKNNRLGMVRELQQDKYSGNLTAVFLDGSPDFIKVAAAYGIHGETLTDEKNADKALITLLASKKPYVLQVSVDESAVSLL
ncbi:MAG: biosynthetic-type acetolactate synthase large subunit [Oscillospiraceae bacterium]|nr:biosynthetic-type acetolactate synthase large subunit [Oscillospiraceae bacterium]